MKQMHMLDLKDLYENLAPGEVILDCRKPDEFKEGHIPGAINISHESLINHVEELEKYQKIYLHCRSGGRVQTAAMDLAHTPLADKLVLVLRSGMLDWVKAGLELEKGD